MRARRQYAVGLFGADPGRGTRLAPEAYGTYLDYSRNLLNDEILDALLDLVWQAGLQERIDGMSAGEKISTSKSRAVLDMALGAPRSESIVVDRADVVPQGHVVLDQMASFSRAVRDGLPAAVLMDLGILAIITLLNLIHPLAPHAAQSGRSLLPARWRRSASSFCSRRSPPGAAR